MADVPEVRGESPRPEMLLCNPWGYVANVAGNFLDLHNSMATTYQHRPFHCTGSAHLCGIHIRCTNPVHDQRNALDDYGAVASIRVNPPGHFDGPDK